MFTGVACNPANLRNARNSDHLLLHLGNRDYNFPKSQHTSDVFCHLMILSWEAGYLASMCPLQKTYLHLIKLSFKESSDWKIGLPVHFQSLSVCREKLSFLRRNTESRKYILLQPSNLGTTGNQELVKGDARHFLDILPSLTTFRIWLSLFCTTS